MSLLRAARTRGAGRLVRHRTYAVRVPASGVPYVPRTVWCRTYRVPCGAPQAPCEGVITSVPWRGRYTHEETPLRGKVAKMKNDPAIFTLVLKALKGSIQAAAR